MIDFYTAQTSNALRVRIMLEECGLPYRAHVFDLMKDEQRSPEFLRINPAGQVPAIVDDDGPDGKPLALAQSGAILLYLAEKTGRFLPSDPVRRAKAQQWLLQALSDTASASVGIFLLSRMAPEKSAANVTFFEERMLRCFGFADAELAQRDYLADELSIADFALYPITTARAALIEGSEGLQALKAWRARLAARPALARAMQDA